MMAIVNPAVTSTPARTPDDAGHPLSLQLNKDRSVASTASVANDPSETWAAPAFRSAKASFVLR